ncbi:MAG: hypothetical protein O9256_00580 [Rhizobiaceae bacterium]|nr:hypothetical protein [Rhizobiaceae bacterium]
MILPPPTDYLRAFAIVFAAGFASGFALQAFASWKYRRGMAFRTAG